MSDLECPYCNAGHEVCHDDGFGYEEGVRHEDECNKCGKEFIFFTHISFNYEPYKAECLNGGEHDWHKFFTSRDGEWVTCHGCGKEKNMEAVIA